MAETRSMRKKRKTSRRTLNLLDLPNEILGRIAQHAVESEYDTGSYHRNKLQYLARIFRLRLVHPIFAGVALPHILRHVWCTYEVRATAVYFAPGSYVPGWQQILALARKREVLHCITRLDLDCSAKTTFADLATILAAVAGAPRLSSLTLREYGKLSQLTTLSPGDAWPKSPSLLIPTTLPLMHSLRSLTIVRDLWSIPTLEILRALLPNLPSLAHVDVGVVGDMDFLDEGHAHASPASAHELDTFRMKTSSLPGERVLQRLEAMGLRSRDTELHFTSTDYDWDDVNLVAHLLEELPDSAFLDATITLHIRITLVFEVTDAFEQAMAKMQKRVQARNIACSYEFIRRSGGNKAGF